MNLIKRIKNLWRLSGMDFHDNEMQTRFNNFIDKTKDEYVHKQPIIIKRTTPVDKFLNQDAK